VVEDNLLLRMETAYMLEDAGHTVVDMSNGDDALAYIYEQAGDIAGVFTDMHMPGHSDGLHVAEVISRHWPHIKVVVTSGRTRPISDLPPGVQFLPKPWILKDVLDRICIAAVEPAG
jgi:CheY-like chemotaxis protein